ncbi:carboxypeptidase-like regulatory domain-containing protein [Flavivirga amylovorans]|uniref:Carboxypeptidase-like regulatory domain-containing protein n=1 Tax=Flavivirga amylovorans TaxID=870486 RepID=A0ABT8X2Q0_9FLAO|nr:carboxypeptidase-like regulatory domain-containing protein [Flavivirga amylovorans]MDO5988231.1 carboxypeptidase-like regulatory domain-containing protein [Flavivirga amylovorans]
MKKIYQFQIKKTIISLIAITFFISSSQDVQALQNNVSVTPSFNQFKGKVIDNDTRKPLVSANLSIEGTNINTITNKEGEFLLKVPRNIGKKNVVISLFGYVSQTILLEHLKEDKNIISLNIFMTELAEINIDVIKDAEKLVREILNKKGENYSNDPTLMTAFYRETIKKRKRNISLSEAIINIYKMPYNSSRRDALQFYKIRKSTDYSRLDTLAFKLQGGPFNTLFIDIMKYPEYIFSEESIPNYTFSFDHSTKVNNKLIHVINFKQKNGFKEPLYKGKLFIDSENKILTSAIYSLNITDKKMASTMFLKKKPSQSIVLPTSATYRVDYREKDEKWYYGYSNLTLDFKVNWKNKLFNSNFSMSCEMAVTDWKKNVTEEMPKHNKRIKPSIIMANYSLGFSDPDFWGEYNIIEPDKSIELAIKKIQKQLKKSNKSAATTL